MSYCRTRAFPFVTEWSAVGRIYKAQSVWLESNCFQLTKWQLGLEYITYLQLQKSKLSYVQITK
jgi:hypothetical protein